MRCSSLTYEAYQKLGFLEQALKQPDFKKPFLPTHTVLSGFNIVETFELAPLLPAQIVSAFQVRIVK